MYVFVITGILLEIYYFCDIYESNDKSESDPESGDIFR